MLLLAGERCILVGFLGLNLLPRGCVLRNVDDFVLSVVHETIPDVEFLINTQRGCHTSKYILPCLIHIESWF
jgi:hypothetical protein